MALEIGGPVSPQYEITRKQFWLAIAILLFVIELGAGAYLYVRVNENTTPASQSPMPQQPQLTPQQLLEVLPQPATTTATTSLKSEEKLLKSLPAPKHDSDTPSPEEQALLDSLPPPPSK